MTIINRVTASRSIRLAIAAALAQCIWCPAPRAAADGGVPGDKAATAPLTIAPNAWADAKLKFVLPTSMPDATWSTTDGYSGATYRSKTGTILWRTGVASKARGVSPGYYSNATLEWSPASGEARVVEWLSNWGGGSYGHGKLLDGFKDHPMPAPRHVYDAFDYVEAEDAVYMMLGSSWKTGLTGADDQAKAQLAIDDQSTWKYSLADGRWHRIANSIRAIWPNVSQHGPSMQYWPEGNKLLCFSDSGYAEFDLKTEKWAKVDLAGSRPNTKGSGPGSSTWDSRRQLWVIRNGPQVHRFDPRARKFDSLAPAYELTPERKFARFNNWAGSGITYIPRHDVYLIHCPSGNDTWVYQIDKGEWARIKGGDAALPFGNLEYDSRTDQTVLVWQHQAFRFRYVPEADKAAAGREKN